MPFSSELIGIVQDYEGHATYSEYIHAIYKTKTSSIVIADILITKIASKELPDDAKDAEPSRKLYKADGVANALALLDEEERQQLFSNWEKQADAKENEKEEQCSKYRRLIAYYAPISELDEKKDKYQVNKIRDYLHDDTIRQSSVNDPFYLVVEIKFLIADEKHDIAFEKLKQLLEKKYLLNVSGADLHSNFYGFYDLDLSYSCFENVKIGESFFWAYSFTLSHGHLFMLPASVKGSNLRGLELKANTPLPSKFISTEFVTRMAQAQDGLEITYVDTTDESSYTLLEFSASEGNTHMSRALLAAGANPNNKKGNLYIDPDMLIKFPEIISNPSTFVTGQLFRTRIMNDTFNLERLFFAGITISALTLFF